MPTGKNIKYLRADSATYQAIDFEGRGISKNADFLRRVGIIFLFWLIK